MHIVVNVSIVWLVFTVFDYCSAAVQLYCLLSVNKNPVWSRKVLGMQTNEKQKEGPTVTEHQFFINFDAVAKRER